MNTFATTFMHELSELVLSSNEGNGVISPFCVSVGIEVLSTGATEGSETYLQLCALMGIDPNDEQSSIDQCTKLAMHCVLI